MLRNLSISLIITLSCILNSPLSQANSHYVVKNVQLLSFSDGSFTPATDISIRDGKIQAIADNINEKGALEIDGSGKFLVPGFTEMHAHIPPQKISAADVEDLLFLYSAYGITTTRGMLGHPSHLVLQEQLKNNQISGPRLITSGPSFNGNSVTSAEQARAIVSKQAELGYDFIKIHPGLSKSSFMEMANQANQFRLPFAGHISASVGIMDSVKAGQATIDHLDGVMIELAIRSGHEINADPGFFGSALVDLVDSQHIAPLARELAQTGVALVPTETLMYGFLSWQPAEISAQKDVVRLMPQETVSYWMQSRASMQSRDWYATENVQKLFNIRRQFLKEFVSAGGVVLLGSDAPQVFNVPGDSLHEEMHLMVQAGMSPIQVLYAASLGPANFFGRDKEFGDIQVGKSADLVLLDNNPLLDITHTRSIRGVMTRGNWVSKQVIDGTLDEIKRKNTK